MELKYAQKYIDEGLQWLMSQGKVKRKEIGKKAFYLAIAEEISAPEAKEDLR